MMEDVGMQDVHFNEVKLLHCNCLYMPYTAHCVDQAFGKFFSHWHHVLHDQEELLSLLRVSVAFPGGNTVDFDTGLSVNEENH